MAKVTVKLFGVYRMDTHLAKAEMQADRLNELLEKLHILIEQKAEENGTAQEVKNLSFKDATVFIGGERCRKKKQKLNDGDEIWILSPASGG
ncbi:MAG: MoaD/ThiS family protein [Ruminococcaceae bacterium]|nr:MoaD/ThiS family protein [Oscillospiraceae bacterium]